LRRVRYFAGQLLDADDLQAEQDYVVARLNRRNRLLHGAGIVSGLDVALEAGAGDPAEVVVAPGLAFDPAGREIHVEAPCRLALPASDAAQAVLLRFVERRCASVPSAAAAAGGEAAETALGQPSRIVETFAASLSPAPDAEAVCVARLHRVRGRWRIDARFTAPRVRR
jgi:hypothetical protein